MSSTPGPSGQLVHGIDDGKVVEEFRANGGFAGGLLARARLLLLTTTGARTGEPRTTPLTYSRDRARIVILASKAGSPRHPSWFFNLRANPEVTIELGTERFRARATVIEGQERDRLFDQQAAEMPPFAEYQRKTTRTIPAVVLDRLE